MDLFDAIEKRSSVRSYKSVQSIPRKDLEKIVDAGRRAPSGANIQPCEYIIITQTETIKKLSKVQSFLSDVPAIIGVITDPAITKYWLEDASAAIENMLLAITALGYASCWVEGTLIPNEDWVKEMLNIPKEKKLLALIPVGVAKYEVSQAPKKSLDEIIHWEKY